MYFLLCCSCCEWKHLQSGVIGCIHSPPPPLPPQSTPEWLCTFPPACVCNQCRCQSGSETVEESGGVCRACGVCVLVRPCFYDMTIWRGQDAFELHQLKKAYSPSRPLSAVHCTVLVLVVQIIHIIIRHSNNQASFFHTFIMLWTPSRLILGFFFFERVGGGGILLNLALWLRQPQAEFLL